MLSRECFCCHCFGWFKKLTSSIFFSSLVRGILSSLKISDLEEKTFFLKLPRKLSDKFLELTEMQERS